MPLDFPTSPTNGQYYNGFVYNAANETWDSAYAPRAATIPITSPNYIINGAFDINQRGFTSSTSQGYGFDRWQAILNGGTVTYSAQSFGTSPIVSSGIEATNYARFVVTGQSAASHYAILGQPIENVKLTSGKTVTVSFWARAASGTPSVAVTFDQFNGTSYSRMVGKKVAITTSWARYSVTLNVPSVNGQTVSADNLTRNRLELWFSAGSDFASSTESLGTQSNTFDVWGVQVEDGAAATEFRRNAPSIQAELAACQRYYWRSSGGIYAIHGYGAASSATGVNVSIPLPVSMRVIPTSIDYSGLMLYDGVATPGVSSLGLSTSFSKLDSVGVTVGSGGLTSTRTYVLANSNSSAHFIAANAEL